MRRFGIAAVLCVGWAALSAPALFAQRSFEFEKHPIGNPGGSSTGSTDFADLDGDGDLDFMMGNAAMYWFAYQSATSWSEHRMGGRSSDVGGDACDIDGDGDSDGVDAGNWHENDGSGNFTTHSLGGFGCAHDTVCADIDGDGDMDVAQMCDRSGTAWWENTDGTGGSWQKHDIGSADHGGFAPRGIGDLDGDGDLDITRVWGWWENDGSGNFHDYHEDFYDSVPGDHPYGPMVRSWIVDMDQDGDNDVVMTQGDTTVGIGHWFENRDGTGGSWSRHEFESGAGDLHSLAVADFDNDGDWDIASCEAVLTGSDRVFVYENLDGQGGSFRRHQVAQGPQCHELVAGDVDQDGDIDIAYKPWEGAQATYLENTLDRGGGLGVADGSGGVTGGGATGDSDSAALLVFTKTDGWRHASIPAGQAMLEDFASDSGLRVDFTENPGDFTGANLRQYDAVVFLNTTENVLNATQQQAFEAWYRAGGGFVGIHAAADTEYDWPWYGELVGAYFESHPNVQQGTISVEDRSHRSTAHLPVTWTVTDEWYNFRSNPRTSVNVLLSLDESSYAGGTMGDHPLAWYHEFDGGRSWYTGLGHESAIYGNANFRTHVLGGIEWVLAASADDASGSTSTCDLIQSGGAVPAGFSPPYNVLSAAREMLVSVSCGSGGAKLSVGAGNQLHYIYNRAYIWRNNEWQQIALSGDTLVAGSWLVGSARQTLPQTAAELGNQSHVVAYVCIWTGSIWKCGCRDQRCVQGRWQLQVFRR